MGQSYNEWHTFDLYRDGLEGQARQGPRQISVPSTHSSLDIRSPQATLDV